MKVVTQFISPPIDVRSHDWCAFDADMEGPTGYGETELAALQDLIPELVEHYETLAYAEGRKDQAAEAKATVAAPLTALYGPTKALCWTPLDSMAAEYVVLISNADYDRVNSVLTAKEAA